MTPIKNILRRPVDSPTRNMMNAFFHPSDQDAFAQSQGYEDAEQMAYYEDMAEGRQSPTRDDVPMMTDREVESLTVQDQTGFIDSLKRAEQHELSKVDSREVYSDEDHINWQDLAGVY